MYIKTLKKICLNNSVKNRKTNFYVSIFEINKMYNMYLSKLWDFKCICPFIKRL